MNDLYRIYELDNGATIQKSRHFLEIYDKLLSRYRNHAFEILEIGVGNGGSLKMWKEYLGPKAVIIGVDIVDGSMYVDNQIQFIQGDQSNISFLKSLNVLPDMIIDDGSHKVQDQIFTFETLFPKLVSGGIYICEDTHTSYREAYGGGYKKPGTFIEYCKELIDSLHCTESEEIPRNNLSNIIDYIKFYRSMVIIKKTGPEGWYV